MVCTYRKSISATALRFISNEYKQTNSYGTHVDQDVTDKWNRAYQALDRYRGLGYGVQSILEGIARSVSQVEKNTQAATQRAKELEDQWKRAKAAADAAAAAARAAASAQSSSGGGGGGYSGGGGGGSSSGGMVGPRRFWVVDANNSSHMANPVKNHASGPYSSAAKAQAAIPRNSTRPYIVREAHKGEGYVKKGHNDEVDKMLGAKKDETVRILKVGEKVVPKDINQQIIRDTTNRSSSTANTFLDRNVTAKTSNAYDRSIRNNIDNAANTFSLGNIIIQGNADMETVKALKAERESLVKEVFNRVNKHTTLSGNRNSKYTYY